MVGLGLYASNLLSDSEVCEKNTPSYQMSLETSYHNGIIQADSPLTVNLTLSEGATPNPLETSKLEDKTTVQVYLIKRSKFEEETGTQLVEHGALRAKEEIEKEYGDSYIEKVCEGSPTKSGDFSCKINSSELKTGEVYDLSYRISRNDCHSSGGSSTKLYPIDTVHEIGETFETENISLRAYSVKENEEKGWTSLEFKIMMENKGVTEEIASNGIYARYEIVNGDGERLDWSNGPREILEGYNKTEGTNSRFKSNKEAKYLVFYRKWVDNSMPLAIYQLSNSE